MTYVVLLFLIPVKGLFSTDRAVGRSCSPDTGLISAPTKRSTMVVDMVNFKHTCVLIELERLGW